MPRRAFVHGKCSGPQGLLFVGHITFELRKDAVYYTWRLEAPGGDFLAEVSQPVSVRTITDGEEPFEFALRHAVVGINRYRINRTKSFEVERYGWEEKAV